MEMFEGTKYYEVFKGFLEVLDDRTQLEEKIMKLVDLRTPIMEIIGSKPSIFSQSDPLIP
jgi:hypothetical protein